MLDYIMNDILKKMSNNKEFFNLYIKYNPSYFLKEFIEKTNIKVDDDAKQSLYANLEYYEMIDNYIDKYIDELKPFYKKVIGLKGFFLQKKYYPFEMKRLYKDIDLLANKKSIYSLFKFFESKGYCVKKDNFLYYNNAFLFRVFRSNYMRTVHCLDMVKTIQINQKKIEIRLDLHFDLNIGSEANFNMDELWKNAVENENSFLELSPYDYAAFLIFHLIKHLCFVNYYVRGLSIDIQKIWDIHYIIHYYHLDLKVLKDKLAQLKIPHYYVLFYKIYNELFLKNTADYQIMLQECKTPLKWESILKQMLDMDIENILLGNYSKDIPELNTMFKKVSHIKAQNFRVWTIRYYVNKINRKPKAK